MQKAILKGQLDYLSFKEATFYSVDQPILIKDIDNPYDDPIERSTYRDGDDPEPIDKTTLTHIMIV